MAAEVDPLLPERLRAETGVMKAERQVFDAAWSSLRSWVPAVADRALQPAVTAAADDQMPDPTAATAEAATWQALVDGAMVAAVEQVIRGRYELADVDWSRGPKVEEYLRSVSNRLSHVPDETFETLRATIDDGLKAGLSIPEMRDEIAQRLSVDLGGTDNEWRKRATTIARTEALAACNGGDQLAREQVYAETAVETDKVWLATLDRRTRPAHFAADGQRVPLAESFDVGGEKMRYPGDPSGSAGNVINCRCTTYEIDRDDASATDLDRGYRENEGQQEVERRAQEGQTRAADNGGRPVTASGQEESMGETPWSGPLAMIDAPTGDGRRFAKDSMSNRDLPLPLMHVTASSYGHDGAVTVGRIDEISYDDAGVPQGKGVFFDPEDPEVPAELAEDVKRAMYLSQQGVVGPSVDLDDVEAIEVRADTGEPLTEDDWIDLFFGDAEPFDVELLIQKGRIAGATLVDIPAFAELMREWTLGADQADEALVAAVNSSWGSVKIAPRDTKWDAAAADTAVSDWAGINEQDAPDSAWSKYGQAFLYQDDSADANTKAAYSLPICTVSDGDLQVVYAGVSAAAGRLGQADIPDADKSKVESAINTLYGRFRDEFDDDTIKSPFEDDSDSSDSGKAALMAAAAAPKYEAAWFANPNLRELTPLTVAADGHVYGHLAGWGTCHVGVGNSCVTAPRSATDYAYFHVGEVDLTDGTSLAVGKITVGGGHASVSDGYRAATEHYDDAATTVAYVRAYEDDHGIAVSGVLADGASTEQVGVLKTHPLSGDWRRVGGSLELIAALAVNTPGFPVPRTREASGRQTALVAAAAVPRREKLDPARMVREAVKQALAEHEAAGARRERAASLLGKVKSARAARATRAVEKIGR